ncbi:hypothetical protein FKM82_018990 [Ascaphus truei]
MAMWRHLMTRSHVHCGWRGSCSRISGGAAASKGIFFKNSSGLTFSRRWQPCLGHHFFPHPSFTNAFNCCTSLLSSTPLP